jgi:hypothetical protein
MNELIELANFRSDQSFVDTLAQQMLENKYFLIN